MTDEAAKSGQMLEPFCIKGVKFRNRILRSSIGGRTATWDGKVTEVWKNFEKRFADGGVGGIVSTTLNVDEDRKAPFQYPALAGPQYVPRLKKYIAEIRETGCRYLIQIGDPGYATQMSLFPQAKDSVSSSAGMDLLFGYNNFRRPIDEVYGPNGIEQAIQRFVDGAKRARETGADGLEITVAKGYLIHQFLNPALNRRTDKWGGSPENRFRFMDEIVRRVRDAIGRDDDFIFGLRLSAEDHNFLAWYYWLLRLPWGGKGNNIEQMLVYVRDLAPEIDFLHVVSGFGFPHPRVVPGKFPIPEVNLFFNHTSDMSAKCGLRSFAFNVLSRTWIIKNIFEWALNIGWDPEPALNLDYARRFNHDPVIRERNPELKIILNGGFQRRSTVQSAIDGGACDMVSMARALVANPDLIDRFWAAEGRDPDPARHEACTLCNRCVMRTGTSPLGCYDVSRFDGDFLKMQAELMRWNRQDDWPGEEVSG